MKMRLTKIFLLVALFLPVFQGCYTIIWTPDEEVPNYEEQNQVVYSDPYDDYYSPNPWWIVHYAQPRPIITVPSAGSGGTLSNPEHGPIDRPTPIITNMGDKNPVITTGSAGTNSGRAPSEKSPTPKRQPQEKSAPAKVDSDSKSTSSSSSSTSTGSSSSSNSNNNSGRNERTREDNSNNSGNQIRNSGEKRR